MIIILSQAIPKSQLDAQRGIGPVSLATRGVGPFWGKTPCGHYLQVWGAAPHILSRQ